MHVYRPASSLKVERIMKWLSRTEFADLTTALDILIDEQFSLSKEQEIKSPEGFLKLRDVTPATKDRIEKAMRYRICCDVLHDLLAGKIELKSHHYAQETSPDSASAGTEQASDPGTVTVRI